MEALHDNSWHVKSADEDMKEATEWLQKAEQLEKQYRDELAAAGNDEQKKRSGQADSRSGWQAAAIGHGCDESSDSVNDQSLLYARYGW